MSTRGMTEANEKRLAYEAKLEKMKEEAQREFEERVERNKVLLKQKVEEYTQQYENEKKAEEEKIKEYSSKNIFYAPKEPEFMLCVRVKGTNKVTPKVKKTLQLLRLTKPNHCVILRNTLPIRKMVQKVKSYVAFGFSDYKLVRELVYKRGMAKVNGARNTLTNEAVEDHFGGEIKCVEELVYQIVKGTDLFKKAANFLWPFTLQPPRKGFGGRKIKDVVEGGSTGNHGFMIGDLIRRMIE
ncbi:60S ribosomal L7 [Tubulinosema ratisbonensis]|uniref:60S ribosomal L7 n=1 Tax=Tubulinosema ratisbonensis TaxID=291195 RepID=A0A437AKG5_9MICR|nr:60S ribosomal L7 [Tubulinosema ratisbonensis]